MRKPAITLAMAVMFALVGSGCGSNQPEVGNGFDLPTALQVQPGTTTDVQIGTFDEGTDLSVSATPDWLSTEFTERDGTTFLELTLDQDAPYGLYTIGLEAATADQTETATLEFEAVE